MQRVFKVENGTISLLKSNPPMLGIAASGTVNSSGWTNPSLGAWVYVTPPKDGIQDFDFTAAPPSGIALTRMTPISASLFSDISPVDYWGKGKSLKGVRIHAQTNKIEIPFKGEEKAAKELSDNRPIPWPWSTGETALLRGAALSGGVLGRPISDLIDREVIVFKTGDAIIKNFNPERVLVELNPAGNRIVSVRFG